MKKNIILLLALILITPILIKAEEERYGYSSDRRIMCSEDINGVCSTFSNTYIYEDGLYKLTGTVKNNYSAMSFPNSSAQNLYCCSSQEGECESMYVFLKGSYCGPSLGYNMILFSNGNSYEDFQNYYVGKGFQYADGVYTLTEVESDTFFDMQGRNEWGLKYRGYYMCEEPYKTTCTNIYKISGTGNGAGGRMYTSMVNGESYFYVSDNYIRKDNQFILQNPRRVYPGADAGESGYTCHSKETTCDQLYYIEVTSIADIHDGGRLVYSYLLNIKDTVIEKEVAITSNYDITSVFTPPELLKIFTTDPSIAEIANGKLVIHKIGEIDVIYEDDTTYKVLHLSITNELLPDNPKTAGTTIFGTILGVLLISALIIIPKKFIN